ncbi:MAG: terminase [Proteobacteria bacterium]|nr:terminase [Pseudomonadota bacterium]
MDLSELVRWQWEGYPRNHQLRANLWLHLVMVPLFLAGNVVLVAGIVRLSWRLALVGILATFVAIALQGRGHKREPNAPEPFTGAGNALSRIFLEQWVTFPRYVLSGGWLHALRSAPR